MGVCVLFSLKPFVLLTSVVAIALIPSPTLAQRIRLDGGILNFTLENTPDIDNYRIFLADTHGNVDTRLPGEPADPRRTKTYEADAADIYGLACFNARTKEFTPASDNGNLAYGYKVGLRWNEGNRWYVEDWEVLCSVHPADAIAAILNGGQPQIRGEEDCEPDELQADPEQATREWIEIDATLSAYLESNQGRISTGFYAQQMYNLGAGSYQNRQAAGGWAGDFTRNTLLVAARDIESNPTFWADPPELPDNYDSSADWWCDLIDGIETTIVDPDNQSHRAKDCSFGRAGNHHVIRHLRPAWEQHFRRTLPRIAADTCLAPDKMTDALLASVEDIRAEHQLLLDEILVPSLENLGLFWTTRELAVINVPSVAREERENAMLRVLHEIASRGEITQDQLRVTAGF
ncbi:MAG: hypothetical protein ABG776_15945 [Cyanobacteria bacterium J06555_13]